MKAPVPAIEIEGVLPSGQTFITQTVNRFLLKEDGGYLLQENGGKIIIGTDTVKVAQFPPASSKKPQINFGK